MNRIRIVHVLWDFSKGGLERLVRDLAMGVDPNRFQTDIISMGRLGALSEGLEDYAGLWTVSESGRVSLLYPRALVRRISALAPDVVHTHGGSGLWYKAVRAARHAGVESVVHTDHGRKPNPSTLALSLEGGAARGTDRIVAVSEGVREFHIDVLKVPSSKMVNVPNGVDAEAFRPRESDDDRPVELPPKGPVIGSVGRSDPIKGYDVMIDAFEILSRNRPDLEANLVIVGDGPERDRLEARASAKDSPVSFLGWVADVERLLPWFDVFSLASHSEGTSLSLLEAMCCGVCPVVTDVGGNPAVLGPALTHRLVPPGDPARLAEAWAASLDDPERRRRDAQTGRDRALEGYTKDRMVQGYQELYEGLVRP